MNRVFAATAFGLLVTTAGTPAATPQTAEATVQPIAAAAPLAAGVAAVVNDELISTYDVGQRAALLLAGAGIEPTPEATERARLQAMRDLVDEHLQMQEAREKKVTVDPEAIDRAVADLARQNGVSVQDLAAQLARSGISMQTLRSQLEADISWRRLVSGRYGSRVRISQNQVRDTLARISASATKPQYLVSEIFLAADTEIQLTQAEAAAARLLEDIRAGAPFPAVARQLSSASSAAAGGDLGWLAQGELRPELQAIVDQLQPGQVSRPIRTTSGVYILALREKRAGVDLAATSRVTLQKVIAPAASRSAFDRQLRRAQGCEAMIAQMEDVPGVEIVDLGETTEGELTDEMRALVAPVAVGRATAIASEPDGKVSAIYVCSRQSSIEGMPSAEDVENRLYDQELAMLAQRYLRNLRRDSTIITR